MRECVHLCVHTCARLCVAYYVIDLCPAHCSEFSVLTAQTSERTHLKITSWINEVSRHTIARMIYWHGL